MGYLYSTYVICMFILSKVCSISGKKSTWIEYQNQAQKKQVNVVDSMFCSKNKHKLNIEAKQQTIEGLQEKKKTNLSTVMLCSEFVE